MPFDIYGENLAPGHCEVHPWVHMEYPCAVCLESSRRRRDEEREHERALEAEYEAYIDKQLHEHRMWYLQEGYSHDETC